MKSVKHQANGFDKGNEVLGMLHSRKHSIFMQLFAVTKSTQVSFF
jgi:hypothetical protein